MLCASLPIVVALVLCFALSDAVDVTICPIVQTGRTGHAQHAAFAALYWAPEVPSLNVTVRFVGTYEAGSSTVRGVVGAFVLQSSGCDAVIGPGISDIATAMNPVVNQMWVEFASSTTDFSSRFNYPYFNRVNPDVSTTQAMFATILQAFGWTHINMFCSSTSYGRSAAGVLSANLGPMATLYNSDCVSNALGYNDTRAVLETMAASPSRVIYFALSGSDPVTKVAQQVVKDMNLTQKKILLWADSICVSGSTGWAFPGSYCAAYDVNATRYNSFYTAYSSRPKTMFSGAIAALGFPSSQIDFNSSKGNQQAYAADAARVALHALDRYYTTHTVPPSQALDAAAAAVRATEVVDGLSGDVYLPLGDRQRGSIKLYNALADGTIAVAASQAADGTISINDQQYALGDYHSKASMPYDVPPPPPAPPAYWAIGVALGVLVIVGVAVAYGVRRHLRLAARPLDGSAPFAVMFVGVKNEAEVRDLGEANANAALAHIRHVVKDAVRATGCFEARRMDDATVMIVAKRAESALECAGLITREIDETDWSTKLVHKRKLASMTKLSKSRSSRRSTVASMTASPLIKSSSRQDSSSRMNSSRLESSFAVSVTDSRTVTDAQDNAPVVPYLNMGVHFGFGMIEHDLETEFVSYHGAVVTRGAMTADAAGPRQVLVTREVVDVVEENGGCPHLGTFKAQEVVSTVVMDASSSNVSSFLAEVYYRFTPVGMSDCSYGCAATDDRRTELTVESGGIATALATADAGLARRRVAVLSIHIPDLAAEPDNLKDVSDLLNDVRNVVTEHKGTVLGILGAQVVVGLNCVGAIVSQPAVRAAALARQLVSWFPEDELTIGITVGTAVAASGVCLGPLSAVAEMTRVAGVAARLPIAAAAPAFAELDSKFQLLTIDCVAVPQMAEACRMYAVLEEIVANDEWLYAMDKKEHQALNEAAWTIVIDPRGDNLGGMPLDDVERATMNIRPFLQSETLSPEVIAALTATVNRLSSLLTQPDVSTTTPCKPHTLWQSRYMELVSPWPRPS